MAEAVLSMEQKDKGWAWMISLALHLLLLLWMILIPSFSYLDPPPEMQGILISLGSPDEDAEEDKESSTKQLDERDPEKPTKPQKKVEKKEIKTSPSKKKVEKAIVDQSTTSDILAANKAQAEKLALIKQQIEADEAAVEQKRQEEAYKKAKSKFGNLFGNGKSSNSSKSKGDPSGKPNAEKLDGISKGAGKVGGGLKDRGLVYVPKFEDKSQKEGRIVIKVCVNASGTVISTHYTQRGSTSSDSELIAIAIKNAKKYQFSVLSDVEEQCGRVTVDFKLK